MYYVLVFIAALAASSTGKQNIIQEVTYRSYRANPYDQPTNLIHV